MGPRHPARRIRPFGGPQRRLLHPGQGVPRQQDRRDARQRQAVPSRAFEGPRLHAPGRGPLAAHLPRVARDIVHRPVGRANGATMAQPDLSQYASGRPQGGHRRAGRTCAPSARHPHAGHSHLSTDGNGGGARRPAPVYHLPHDTGTFNCPSTNTNTGPSADDTLYLPSHHCTSCPRPRPTVSAPGRPRKSSPRSSTPSSRHAPAAETRCSRAMSFTAPSSP